MKCKICDSSNVIISYEGKIREGKFGNYLENKKIYKCKECHISFYDDDLVVDYTSSEYREMVQSNPTDEEYYKQHDEEQIFNLDVIGLDNIRNKTIADVGCGAGSFLDVVSGITEKQIAVEPFKDYQVTLKKKGYSVYDYACNAQKEFGTVDIVSSFAVIEHVDDPVSFLSDLKQLVRESGYVIISTPNANDFQLELVGDEYKSFYYRHVHQWYFNEASLEYLSSKLGFKRVEFIYKHKYDFSNFLFWIKDKKPTGLGKISVLNELTDVLVSTVENNGSANFLYAKFYV